MVEGYTIDAEVGPRWDGRADAWDVVSRGPAFARFCDAIMAAAAPGPRDVVLDIGCGTGLVTLPAARRAARTIGIDASATMLERLRARAAAEGITDIRLIHGDMRRLPSPTGASTSSSRATPSTTSPTTARSWPRPRRSASFARAGGSSPST